MLMNAREFLEGKVHRNSIVVNQLKDSQAWGFILEDFEAERKRIDDSWALVDDESKLKELRIAKLATLQVINMLSAYEHDLKSASEQLERANSPEELSQINYGDQ